MIGLELKQKAEEHTEKTEKRGKNEWREKEEERGIVWEGKEWAIAFAAVPQLATGLFLIRMYQDLSAGSLLSAVCLNVKAIGGNWWSQRNFSDT